MPSPHAARRRAFRLKPEFLLLLILVSGATALRAAVDWSKYANANPKDGMKPLEALAWDAAFMVTPSTAGDPLQPVGIDYAQPYHSPDEHAQRVPKMFEFDRSNGKIPFVFIEANIKPRFRRDLVPVMRVGPLGLFTDRAVPEYIQRGVEQCIRNKAAQMPGGAFKLNGEPVELGGGEDLISYLEGKDQERDEDNGLTRAINKSKWSADKRQDLVLDKLLEMGLRDALGGRTYSLSAFSPSPTLGPEAYFTKREWAEKIVAKGEIPIIYAPADTPKSAMEGFPPIARIGTWGVWGSAASSAADLQLLERTFATMTSNEDFREAAYLLAVDDFGGPDGLRQLVAQTQERKPLAKVAVAPVKPGAATPPVNGGDLRGPALPGSEKVPLPGDPIRRDPPIPKPIFSKKGDLPAWQPLSDADKAKNAKDQADFAQRMAAKQQKIEELKKQRAKDDTDRFNNNMKILREWCRQKQGEQDALNQRMIEKLRAAEHQAGAVTSAIEEVAGEPRIIWTNHTDVVLYVEFTYTGTVDGVSVGEQQGSTLALPGTSYVNEAVNEFFGLNGRKYSFQILSVRWWAREQDNQWRH